MSIKPTPESLPLQIQTEIPEVQLMETPAYTTEQKIHHMLIEEAKRSVAMLLKDTAQNTEVIGGEYQTDGQKITLPFYFDFTERADGTFSYREHQVTWSRDTMTIFGVEFPADPNKWIPPASEKSNISS